MPIQEQEAIVDSLFNIPPSEWLKELTHPDQLEHFEYIRGLNYALYWEFKTYFSGLPSPNHTLDEHGIKSVKLMTKRYLSLYCMLRESWTLFISAGKQIRPDFSNIFPNPGAVLITMLTNKARAMLEECLVGYLEVSPSKRGEFNRDHKKLQDHEIPKLKKSTSLRGKSLEEVQEHYDKEILNRDKHATGFAGLEILCIQVCRKNALTNSEVKEELRRFNELDDKLHKHIQSATRKTKAYAWKDGQKGYSAPGGKYEFN
ncbi:hypothetical protein Pse7367_3192 [Thalassoporum mexicanum PCC 7367]|nr:hypothetical protein Pse7367_3192 [Pseudanabaena sp. PCC 7367]